MASWRERKTRTAAERQWMMDEDEDEKLNPSRQTTKVVQLGTRSLELGTWILYARCSLLSVLCSDKF